MGATITEMRPITPSPRRHRVSGARTRGAEGIEEKGNDRARERERECVCGQSSLGFPLERHRRDAGLS